MALRGSKSSQPGRTINDTSYKLDLSSQLESRGFVTESTYPDSD